MIGHMGLETHPRFGTQVRNDGIDITARLKDWSPPEPNYRHGVLARYALLVGSASEGAILKP